MMDEARAAGAIPVLIGPLSARACSEASNKIAPDLRRGAAVIRETAAAARATYVDLLGLSDRCLGGLEKSKLDLLLASAASGRTI